MKTLILAAALSITSAFGALANQVDFEGTAQLFQHNFPKKVLDSNDILQELSRVPHIYLEAKNSQYFDQLINRAMAKSSQGYDGFQVMYEQREIDRDESDLTDEQKQFYYKVRSQLNDAYMQFDVSTDTRFFTVSCVKKYSVDYDKLTYQTKSGCFIPTEKVEEISKLIASSNTTIDVIPDEDIASLMDGEFPESLRQNKDFLELAEIYGGEAAMILGMGSYMYNRPIRAVISGTDLYLITSGSNTTTVFADLQPMTNEDKMKYAPETLGSELVESRMNQDGSVVCHQKEAEKNTILLGGSKKTECLYKLNIAGLLSTIQR